MYILVINCGSSSLKAEVIDAHSGKRSLKVRVNRIQEAEPELLFSDQTEAETSPVSGQAAVLRYVFEQIKARFEAPLAGIGHRVVHGGIQFQAPTLIDETVEQAVEALSPLAPLHNPVNLQGIRLARSAWQDLPHVAIFDTAFHSKLPSRAQAYALPRHLVEKHGIRRFGFHGTSHQYVARTAAQYLGFPAQELRIISCHLGSGASVCAIEYGRSVETSMGMTPLEGLVMATRSGDLDPSIAIKLMQAEGWTAQELDRVLNQESGLKGMANENDMRDLLEQAAAGNEAARQAIQVFCHRVRKYIGAYAAVMGGADAVIFTGGIGENSATIRDRVAQRLNFLGAIIDEDANRDAELNGDIASISTPNSRCKLLVIPTDEQYEIARQSAQVIEEKYRVRKPALSIPVAVSARHVHLTQETVEKLFGPGHQLTPYKELSQPGQYAAQERVTLVGPKNKIERVRILGPTRSLNQVEISRTDEFFLGIDAPIRASGHVAHTPGITLIGPKGSITLKEGVICAWRHIHMTPEDAEAFGVEDKDIVSVAVDNEQRSLIFGNVLVRVSPKYKLEMHIDTDEGNAAELFPGAEGSLVSTGEHGALIKKDRVPE